VIEVEIWSDYACPFCYIGKKLFEQALAQFSKRGEVKVIYKSFELDPSAPKSQNKNIYEVLAKKYGRSVEWAHEANKNVVAMAEGVGLKFHMEKIIPTNTFDAHRLSHLAMDMGFEEKIQDLLFSAYFTEGKDLSNHKVLKEIASQVGMDEKAVSEALEGKKKTEDVRNDENEARELEITGVPFFIFNRKFAVSGAQPTEIFLEALKRSSN
jgi:protein disulfide-isomerase